MSDKQVIGECSLCGGPVEQYTMLHIVGPFPPPQCRNCGAVAKRPHGPVIEMEPRKPRNTVAGGTFGYEAEREKT